MTRYFMKFTPLFAAEVQMMTPPRHQPRRSGRIRSSFRYSADDVRCKDCCFSKRMRKLFRKNEKSVLRFCNKSSKTKRAFTKVLMPCKRPF